MGSRDKDSTSYHQPLLSSLVVRASNTDGIGGTSGGRGSDYEAGEVRRVPPQYSRLGRYSDDLGYRIHVGTASATRRRNEHQYISDFDHSGGLTRGRDFGGRRDLGRYRDTSPQYSRRISGSRPSGRGFDGTALSPGPRGERSKNNPNVRPRDGDWYCTDPLCDNLNFARREFCNNCKRPRTGAGGSSRRGGGSVSPPSLHSPPKRFAAYRIECSPVRTPSGYRSPPRTWARDGPRDIAAGGLPPPSYESRHSDLHLRRDRVDYLEEDGLRGRSKFDRPTPAEWALRDRGRDDFITGRKVFERRPPSPPLLFLPQHGRLARAVRKRSCSPIRGPVRSPLRISVRSPPKDFRRDVFFERETDDMRGLGRERNGGLF